MKLLIIGRTASGKDVLREALEHEGLSFARSYTDRPRREGEGDTHRFVSASEMDRLMPDLVLTTAVGEYRYGIERADFDIADGLVVDPGAIDEVAELASDDVIVLAYMSPVDGARQRVAALARDGDESTLEARLEAEDERFAAFERRLDEKSVPSATIRIVNDYEPATVEGAVQEVLANRRMLRRLARVVGTLRDHGVFVSSPDGFHISVVMRSGETCDMSPETVALSLLGDLEGEGSQVLAELVLDYLKLDTPDM